MGHEFVFASILIIMSQPVCGLLLDGVEVSQSSLQKRVHDLEQQLVRHNSMISTKLECLPNCKTVQFIAFMATLATDLVNPAKGHVIVFDDVITNVGNAYNPLHGIFTAPVNGTYNINLVVSSPNAGTDHGMHIFLKMNGIVRGEIFLDSNINYWIRRSTIATLHLIEKDEIWAEVGDNFGVHTVPGCAFCTFFTGNLIFAD